MGSRPARRPGRLGLNSAARVLRLVIFALATAACSASAGDQLPDFDNSSQLPYGEEYRRLYAELAEGGASVEAGVPIVWTAEMVGHFMRVDGADIQLFEYVTIEEARRGAAKVARDGSYIALSTAEWAGEPHFYRRGRVMVLYIGDDAGLQRQLRELLGQQFAGYSPPE